MTTPKKQNVTLSDVAKLAGVSRTSAAKVLLGTGGDHVRIGEEASQRVKEAAAQLNYKPNRAAQQLAGAKTRTLGILMDTVNAPVMNDRLAAIEKETSKQGYRLLIGQVHQNNSVLKDYLDDFESRGVDAILCLFDLNLGREKRLIPLIGNRHNIIMHGKSLNENGYCIRVDTTQAIKKLVEHLHIKGYKRIALLLDDMKDELMTIRNNAFIEAMSNIGRKVHSELIYLSKTPETIPSLKTLNIAIEHLVVQAKADAIIAANDLWAARMIQALKQKRYKIPENIAITGYDNLDLATIIDPPLTTIDQQHDSYAKAAVDMMIKLASGIKPDKKTITILPKLIHREST